MKVPRIVFALAAVAAVFTLAPSARATECSADVRSTPGVDQITDEVVTKVFLVEVDTQEACATVYVDATITERLFNGEEIKSTRRGSRKVSNHTSTHKVNLRIARDSTLVGTSFKVARCAVCGTE